MGRKSSIFITVIKTAFPNLGALALLHPAPLNAPARTSTIKPSPYPLCPAIPPNGNIAPCGGP